MKKILIISDTHSHLDTALVKYISAADEVWHAGDIGDISICDEIEKLKPLKVVWGNIDGIEFRKRYKENLIFNCEEVKVFITHIGGYPSRYNATAEKTIQEEKPQLFICGHSHILKVMFDKKYDLLHINPGACGNYGIHTVKTAIQMVIDVKEMKDLNIIELGKRI